MKRFLVLIMASVFFASGMPPAESRAADARRDNPASSGMITSTKTELQIPQ